jgi:hypothetical protein
MLRWQFDDNSSTVLIFNDDKLSLDNGLSENQLFLIRGTLDKIEIVVTIKLSFIEKIGILFIKGLVFRRANFWKQSKNTLDCWFMLLTLELFDK